WNHKINIYNNAGYKTLAVSTINNNGIDELKELLQNKTSLFSGHSGVGKRTLLNRLHQNLQLKTTEISQYSGKGQHTTTFAEMYALNNTTNIIDTPGIKEFGVANMMKSELSHYFPEIRQ